MKNMERMTYVDEDGTVLFSHKHYPKEEGVTITTLAEDEQFEFLEEISERLANREQVCEMHENKLNSIVQELLDLKSECIEFCAKNGFYDYCLALDKARAIVESKIK